MYRISRIALGTLAVAACRAPKPVVAPTPQATPAAPPSAGPPFPVNPALPRIPLVVGPLALKVVYPTPSATLTSRDSDFIIGSVGNGNASLAINGASARVYPNGAFMAFVPNPPPTAPHYDLVAVVGTDTARLSEPVRILPPRPTFGTSGPLFVDSNSVSPRTPMLLRADEPVRISLRAAPNATVWVTSRGSARSLTSTNDGALWAIDLPARVLHDGATVTVARDADTARFSLGPVDLVDSVPHWLQLGDVPAVPDTDRVIVGRPTPGGTYKWFLLPGVVAVETGRMASFTRVRLDDGLEIWVGDEDIRELPPTTLAPHRVTSNARVRSAPGWVDLVIPISDRPAHFVEADSASIALTLYGVRANTDIINYAANDTLVHSVEWEQVTNDRARYVVHLRQPVYGWMVMWEPGAVVLRIRRRPTINRTHPLSGMIIAVDPGHPPSGATGPTGLYEGNAVFPVGQRLQRILQSRGATVLMTRTNLGPVDLGLRPILARRANANAFVSIHLNAYGDGVNPFTAVNGSGTYFFWPASEPLARPIQRGLVANLGLPDLGVNYDNLAVLRIPWFPAVLCEGAFVIIPEQEAAMRTAEFQERYAIGIADGLEEYFRRLGASY